MSDDIFEPLLRLVSSFKVFSSGSKARSVLLYSLVGLLATLSQRLGQLDARDVMTPLLQRFFSCFDCVYRLVKKEGSSSVVARKYSFFTENHDGDDIVGHVEVNLRVNGESIGANIFIVISYEILMEDRSVKGCLSVKHFFLTNACCSYQFQLSGVQATQKNEENI